MASNGQNEQPASRIRHPWLLLVAIAVAYYLMGRASVLLSVPPGFASPVWPSAGIALVTTLIYGYRVCLAVFAGSFAVNIMTTSGLSSEFWSLDVLLVPTIIAGGAALQAIVGAVLIRRSVGFPNPLTDGRTIAVFLILGAPVSSLVNATIGAGALFLLGAIEQSFLFTWAIWWLGDSIGVLIMGPLVLLAVGRPRAIWRSRRLSVGVPLTAAVAAVLVVFFIVRTSEFERQRDEFAQAAGAVGQAVSEELARSTQFIESIDALFHSSTSVSRTEFRAFTSSALRENGALSALFWTPRIRAPERAAFVQMARFDVPDYELVDFQPEGRFSPAGERDEYVPVRYSEPRLKTARIMGLDLMSEPERAEVLHQARDTGRTLATGHLRLIALHGRPKGILLIRPVFHNPRALSTTEMRRKHLYGYIVGAFTVSRLLEKALRHHTTLRHVEVRVFDVGPDAGDELLAVREVGSEPASSRDMSAVDAGARPPLSGFDWHETLDVGGRTWRLEIVPTASYRQVLPPAWHIWGLLAGGLIMASILASFTLVITGYTTRMEREVKARTEELARINKSLEDEIAERERTARALTEAKDAAEAATHSKGEFLARMSHEIRTPMNAIMGMTELILESELSSEQREYLDTVNESAEILLSIINDVLDFSKLEVGKLELRPVVFSPRQLIKRMERLFAARAKQAEVALRPHIGDSVPDRVQGDPNRLAQVLMNLISNAIKFTEPGGHIDVSLELKSETQTVIVLEFRVRDSGIGIPETDQARIFESFEQGDSSSTRVYGGTGLGLAISNHLVRLMGGTIGVESRPTAGSTFSFTVEVDHPTAVAKTATISETFTGNPEVLMPLRVLLVEDNPINRMVATQILQREGHDVTQAHDGREAVDYHAVDEFDIVLMDLQMPVMDGLEATQRIREHERDHYKGHIPIVALTAHAMESDRLQCLEAGMDDVLVKPVRREDLLKKLRRLTRKRARTPVPHG